MARPRARRRRAPAAVMIVALLVACGANNDPVRGLEAERTDSAGEEIVVNALPASAVPVFATLDSVPTLRLGSLGGQPEEQFGAVTDVLPLPDGGVAVLDGQAAEIRLFDSDGAYRATLGSEGQGPGELQSPTVLALRPGDTLAVFDRNAMRITRFAPDGTLGPITTLESEGPRMVTAAFLPDGRLVGQSRWLSGSAGPLPREEPTFVRDTAVLTVFTPDGSVGDTIDVVPGREAVQTIRVGERSISIAKPAAAFGRTNLFATHPDGIWSSPNDRFELRLRNDMSGRLLRIVRAPRLDRPVTDHLAREVRERALAEAESPADRRSAEEWYDLSPRPETLPAYDRIVVDDRARLWVREWSGLDFPTRWWVFEDDGNLLGSVDVPKGTVIMAVRCGRVWGVEQDQLDVSYVVRYALRGVEGAGPCDQPTGEATRESR